MSGSIAPRIEDAKAIGRIIGLKTSPFETRHEKRIKETNTPALVCVFRPDIISFTSSSGFCRFILILQYIFHYYFYFMVDLDYNFASGHSISNKNTCRRIG